MFPRMAYETVRYDVGDGVATIALDQPETRNALSDELLDDLIAAFTAARDDDAVRCVVLTSTHETIAWCGRRATIVIAATSSPFRNRSRVPSRPRCRFV